MYLFYTVAIYHFYMKSDRLLLRPLTVGKNVVFPNKTYFDIFFKCFSTLQGTFINNAAIFIYCIRLQNTIILPHYFITYSQTSETTRQQFIIKHHRLLKSADTPADCNSITDRNLRNVKARIGGQLLVKFYHRVDVLLDRRGVDGIIWSCHTSKPQRVIVSNHSSDLHKLS